MDKRSKWLDRAQNLLIAALTLSFLFLLVQTPLFGEQGMSGLSAAVRGLLVGESAEMEVSEQSFTTLAVPVQITQSNGFIRSGSEALTTADTAFENVATYLAEAIGSAYSIASVPESVFLSALLEAGVTFTFASPLPLEVLSARLGVTAPTTRALDVQRCCLSVGNSENVQLYLQDTSGFFSFSTAVRADALTEYLETPSGQSVSFAASLGEEYALLSPYTLVFSEPAARRALSGANALNDAPTDELLRAAEFNPHTRDRYSESSGTQVIIEAQRRLYLHTDGSVSYSGGAAEPDSLFHIEAADPVPTRTEVCSAARRAVAALAQGRTGDASLYLSGMRSDEKGFTVTFDYMVDGTPVRFSDGSHAAEVRTEGTSITAFSLRLRRYTRTDAISPLLPLSLAGAIAQRYPDCLLAVAYVDSFADTVSASWVAD